MSDAEARLDPSGPRFPSGPLLPSRVTGVDAPRVDEQVCAVRSLIPARALVSNGQVRHTHDRSLRVRGWRSDSTRRRHDSDHRTRAPSLRAFGATHPDTRSYVAPRARGPASVRARSGGIIFVVGSALRRRRRPLPRICARSRGSSRGGADAHTTGPVRARQRPGRPLRGCGVRPGRLRAGPPRAPRPPARPRSAAGGRLRRPAYPRTGRRRGTPD